MNNENTRGKGYLSGIGGYGIIPRLVIESRDIGQSAKLVYTLLASYTGNKLYCFPKIKTIAASLKMSKNTVYKSLKELEANGFLEIEKRTVASCIVRNIYILKYPIVDNVPDFNEADLEDDDEDYPEYEVSEQDAPCPSSETTCPSSETHGYLNRDTYNINNNNNNNNNINSCCCYENNNKQQQQQATTTKKPDNPSQQTTDNKQRIDTKGRKKQPESPTPQVSPRAPLPTAKRFVKPSLDDITAYCRERKNAIDPGRFYDYYEAKGWMVGKTHMKDWKAAVRLWERNESRGYHQKDALTPEEQREIQEKAKYVEYARSKAVQVSTEETDGFKTMQNPWPF